MDGVGTTPSTSLPADGRVVAVVDARVLDRLTVAAEDLRLSPFPRRLEVDGLRTGRTPGGSGGRGRC